MPWRYEAEDREFFQRELEVFVPPRVYDMHAHLWRVEDWEGKAPEFVKQGPQRLTLATYRELMGWLLPGREVHGLHFPFPAIFPTDPSGPNAWVSGEVRKDPLARGQFYVRPSDDPERARQEARRLCLRGFKPFIGFIGRADKGNAEIPEYFPEWIARVAHEEGWTVTLHMQRARSLADPSNQHWIRTYCSRYPDMTLILDHCARGFNPYHAMEGLKNLGGIPNLYADTSVVCNPLAVVTCVNALGIDHLFYGSDFYCSHLRGTNLPVGDSFLWLEDGSPAWADVAYGARPVLLGLENLRAVKAAFELLRLNDREIESYFWGNAQRVLDLPA